VHLPALRWTSAALGCNIRTCPQLTVGLGPDDKTPIVRQDTVRENPNRVTLVRPDHDAFGRVKVGRLAEQLRHRLPRSIAETVNIEASLFLGDVLGSDREGQNSATGGSAGSR
jgi:hypothetical protein